MKAPLSRFRKSACEDVSLHPNRCCVKVLAYLPRFTKIDVLSSLSTWGTHSLKTDELGSFEAGIKDEEKPI